MIKPTIGRVVLVNRFSHGASLSPQPEPALICRVWHDRMINVGGFDANGQPFSLVSVQLLQDDDAAPSMANGAYAEWMPYQKAQAGIAPEPTTPDNADPVDASLQEPASDLEPE